MIELKVGDKFVVKDAPLGGEILIIKEICGNGKYKVLENEFTWHLHEHIDLEATKKLREVKKTYEWHEAIKMAAEGIPMCVENANDYIKLVQGKLNWIRNKTGYSVGAVLINESNCWARNWIPYIEPINLTDVEKTILKNVDGKYKWIARDKDEFLYLFAIKPTKIKHWIVDDEGKNMTDLEAFNHLFQQIKWEDEEPTLIKELLGNS